MHLTFTNYSPSRLTSIKHYLPEALQLYSIKALTEHYPPEHQSNTIYVRMLNRKKMDLTAGAATGLLDLISRISSSQKLDSLSSHNTPVWSDPTTPFIKLPSPSPSVMPVADPDPVEISIHSLVSQLELDLNYLSQQVSSFQEDKLLKTVTRIVSTNRALGIKTRDLANYAQLGSKMASLQSESNELDVQLKDILRKLVSYRSELNALPKLSSFARQTDTNAGLDVNDALQYALKLAKFTKAPASMANSHHQLHPNNFVWPAEDALRRGMLAASSLKPDEIIMAEIGGDMAAIKSLDSKSDPVDLVSNTVEVSATTELRRESAPAEPQQALDLDLFDEDEFSD